MENDVLWQVREEKVNFMKQFQWFIEVLTPLSEITGFPACIMNSNSPRSVASLVFATNFFLYFAISLMSRKDIKGSLV